MTGDNFEVRNDFQPAFWPSDWHYEPQHMFGAMDAPDWQPAGGMRRYEGENATFPVTLAASRGME